MKLLKIKNIKKVQNNSLLYDIETKKNHNFFANGVLVHNSSATYIKEIDGSFRVCSRNLELKDTEGNVYWQMARKYNIEERLQPGYSIQGEIAGPGIQSNPAGLSEVTFFIFNVINLCFRKPLVKTNWVYAIGSLDNDIPTVPQISLFDRGTFSSMSIDDLQQWTNSIEYQNKKPAEGVVLRGFKDSITMYSQKLQKMLSVKIINQNYKD